jgi:hypothetical protein
LLEKGDDVLSSHALQSYAVYGADLTSPDTEGVLAEVALSAPGCFATFDDLVTLTVKAADRDARHGPFLPKRNYEDEAQCDSHRSPYPLLKHYQVVTQGRGRAGAAELAAACTDGSVQIVELADHHLIDQVRHVPPVSPTWLTWMSQ